MVHPRTRGARGGGHGILLHIKHVRATATLTEAMGEVQGGQWSKVDGGYESFFSVTSLVGANTQEN